MSKTSPHAASQATIDAQLEAAYEALSHGDAKTALQAFESVKPHLGKDPRADFVYTEILLAQGEEEQALKHNKKSCSLFPEDPALVYQRANLLLELEEDPKQAQSLLETLIAKSQEPGVEMPKELLADCHLLLADVYEAEGKTHKQLKAMQDAMAVFPNDARVRVAYANALFDAGFVNEALTATEKAMEKDSIADDYWLLGRILTFQHEYNAAQKAFAQATKLDPERFYDPIEFDEDAFLQMVNKALKEVPAVIADFIESTSLEITETPSKKLIDASDGALRPSDFAYTQSSENFSLGKDDPWEKPPERVYLFWRNIALASKDILEVKECIKSALIHQGVFYLDEDPQS